MIQHQRSTAPKANTGVRQTGMRFPLLLACAGVLVFVAVVLWQWPAVQTVLDRRFSVTLNGVLIYNLLLVAVFLALIIRPLFRQILIRKRAEAALRDSVATTRTLLDALPDMIFRLRRDGTYLDYLPADGQGPLVPPEQFIGKRVDEVLPADVAAGALHSVRQALDTGDVQVQQYALPVGGRARYYESRVVSYAPDEVLAIVRDITEPRHTADALRKSEATTTALLRTVPDLVFRFTADGTFTDYRASRNADLYLPPDAFLGRRAQDVLPSDLAGKTLAAIREALATDEVQQFEYPMEIDGHVRHFEARHFPSGDGEVLALVREITERKEAEEALRSSEERYRGLIESQNDLIVRVAPSGVFTFVNDAYCRMFGKSAEELLGSSFVPLVHEDDIADTLAAMAKLSEPPYRSAMEQRALTVHGWRWLSWEDCAIRNEAGEIVEIQAIGRDITEHKRVEEALRANEAKYRSLVEQLPAVTYQCRVDANGVEVLYASPQAEAMIGCPAQQLSPDTLTQMVHPEERDRIAEQVARRNAEGVIETLEFRICRPDGRIIWVADRAALITEEDGARCYQGILIDITERKLAEERMRLIEQMLETDRLKSEFLALVSHELRTPLTPIRGMVDLLMVQQLGPLNEQQMRTLEIVQTQAVRLQSLISDMLDLYSLESGRMTLELEPLPLAPVIAETCQVCRARFEDKGLTLDYTVEEGLPAVWGDGRRLTQVLVNLLDNAAKFTTRGGARVRAYRQGERVRLEVADTGIGLSADEAKRIFARFYQVEPHLTRRHGGTGLGLAIVRLLVEAMHGRVWVESPGPHHGSTFVCLLPCAPEQHATDVAGD